MSAELISVGTELLMGNIVNTNAQYISQRLADLGIDCYLQTTVGDNHDRLVEAVHGALRRADRRSRPHGGRFDERDRFRCIRQKAGA